MNQEIREIMETIKRMRQRNAAHCITHGIVDTLPRCPHCGVLYPCDCDPMEYREAREPVRYIRQDGRKELY